MTASQLVIGRGNEDQAAAWDGDEGEQWAARPEFYDSSIRRHHARLLAAARIGSDDHVLDIGCGNGLTTRDAARAATAGLAVGVDLSSQMIERAWAFAADEGLANASFVQADAQVHPFAPEAFDIVISRFGSMFFADQVAAFTNIKRAMCSGARLVLLSWQALAKNEWLTSFSQAMSLGQGLPTPPADAPSPFGHADPDRTTQILTDAGFEDVALDDINETMYFGADADDAFATLSELFAWMMQGLEGSDRSTALEKLRATLGAHETADGVAYDSAAWLITARLP